MRVFVTGHAGYVGTVLTPLLRLQDHELFGWDCDLYRQCNFSAAPPDILHRRADIRDITAGDLDGYDAVVHLAGLSNDPLGNINPSLTQEINCGATVRLAELARDAGVRRFLFSSTCSVYGAAGDDWVDEESSCAPVTPYAVSKLEAERELIQLASPSFSPVILRSATIYGSSPRIRFDLVVNNLTAWALSTGRVLLKSDGTAWRPLLHVSDMALAFSAVLSAPLDAVHNQIFNVGSTEANYRVHDIAQIIADHVTDAVVENALGASTDVRSYRVNFDKIARTLPGFRPRWTLERGVKQLIESLGEQVLSPADFEGSRYQRLAHLRWLLDSGLLDDSLRWRTVPALHSSFC